MPSQNAIDTKLFIRIDIYKKSWSASIKTESFDHKLFFIPCYPQEWLRFFIANLQYTIQ